MTANVVGPSGCPTSWDQIRCWFRAEVGQVARVSCVNASQLFADNDGGRIPAPPSERFFFFSSTLSLAEGGGCRPSSPPPSVLLPSIHPPKPSLEKEGRKKTREQRREMTRESFKSRLFAQTRQITSGCPFPSSAHSAGCTHTQTHTHTVNRRHFADSLPPALPLEPLGATLAPDVGEDPQKLDPDPR